ncbi:MAG: peroxidase [Acidobacteria bacterium]|nr:peroxidase [Acidobacteriota bacterium]
MSKVPDKEWYELPFPAAAPKLIAIRNELRSKNLHDTEDPPLEASAAPAAAEGQAVRTNDGTHNDLRCPRMGSAGVRFGRNVPLAETMPDTANLLTPNPRTVSLELLNRTTFQPAEIVNILAAAWIQFQVHDWFMHKKGVWTNTHNIPLADGDTWHERPMRIPITPADIPKDPNSTRPPAYANQNTHWWDGSQVYGSTTAEQAALRLGRDGKVMVGDDGRLGVDPSTGLEITGFTENAWVGLSLLHGVFAMEHNAICSMLKRQNVHWDDERVFQQARLINSALLARIHTVEWTPAILPNPITAAALRTNWRGLLGDLQKVFTHLNDNELLGGIPGSPTDHHTAPYSLTEEFVSVYRMHELIPDDYTVRSAKSGQVLGQFTLPEFSGSSGRKVVERFDCADLFYSLGTAHPGAIRLHNFPRHLQNLTQPNGDRLDLGTIDIMRDRERGVPRYNQFRRLFHKSPVTSFEQVTDNPAWADDLRRVYNNDLEKIDLHVGLVSEPLPPGFGFSETAFRVFVLMASRRLKSDRFLSKDYRKEIYTQDGIDWVENTSMIDILSRHFPSTAPAMKNIESAFHPWRKVV